MRIRIFVSIVSVLLLLALSGTALPRAQSQALDQRESPWATRGVAMSPTHHDDGDDESDDEGDDECSDFPAPIGKTGQTIAYGSRDDGELQKGVPWPEPRFADNLDGTVTDLLSGLVWLQDATRFSGANWNTSLAACNELADDGAALTDGSVAGEWRLPSNKELRSLIDFGNVNPALPSGHPFTVPPAGAFWSSTTGTNNTGRAWTIEDGEMVNDPKNTPNRIWPARDAFAGELGPAPVSRTGQIVSYGARDDGELQKGVEWPAPRFTDDLDGTVTDELTGLIWLADSTRFVDLSFHDALDTCNALGDDGMTLTDGSVAGDWRLPNLWELASLNDFGQKGPALPAGHPFIAANAGDFWSSTTAETNSNRAWTVGMGIGRVSTLPKASLNQVWPVRGCAYEDDDDEDGDEDGDEDEGYDFLPYDDLETPETTNETVDFMARP